MAIGACMWSGVETLTESRFFLLVEQLAPVLVDVRALGEALADGGAAGRIHLGDGDERDVVWLVSADVARRHAVGPEAGVPHAPARRLRHQVRNEQRRRDRRGGGLLQKRTAAAAGHDRSPWNEGAYQHIRKTGSVTAVFHRRQGHRIRHYGPTLRYFLRSAGTGVRTLPVAAHSTPRISSVWKPRPFMAGHVMAQDVLAHPALAVARHPHHRLVLVGVLGVERLRRRRPSPAPRCRGTSPSSDTARRSRGRTPRAGPW